MQTKWNDGLNLNLVDNDITFGSFVRLLFYAKDL